jgi:glutathione S-transferase
MRKYADMNHAIRPIRLYRHPLSGHCHRVQLLMSLLELPFETIDVDLVGRAHKHPDFLSKNPLGQVPVIEDGEVTVADSNAILVYLAKRYDPTGRWLPGDPILASRVQRWLSIAAGELAAGPAAARLAVLFGAKIDTDQAKRVAIELFRVLDAHLSARLFLVGDDPTIADVAIYSYTAHAPEGGVSLDPFQNLRAWLTRFESRPGFLPMKRALA